MGAGAPKLSKEQKAIKAMGWDYFKKEDVEKYRSFLKSLEEVE